MWNQNTTKTLTTPCVVTLSLAIMWPVFLEVPVMSAEIADSPLSQWQRTGRVTVYNSPRRARYPSVVKADDGSLLVLFTRQTEEQEQAGRGDLLLVRSTDNGESWSAPDVVYESADGEPRAVGTMTKLKDGRIVAPLVELNDNQSQGKVRLLASDDGRKWQVRQVSADLPLIWWAPCGRVIEAYDGTLVMAVYGATSDDDLKATIHNCGLLRSCDGGATWGDYSTIARGREDVVGAAPGRRFSFEGPHLQLLADGSYLAMVTARRLNAEGTGPSPSNEGPGAPLLLCRLWTSDGGRSWTQPNQLSPGAWPTLGVMGNDTLCVNTLWSAWGEMRLLTSRDGFNTIHQEVEMLRRGWIRGRANNPREAPLPPTVPYLTQEWAYEHYGFPSIVTLDDDRLVVVFGRTQGGTPGYFYDPRAADGIPLEQERITAVFYRRAAVSEQLAAPPVEPPPRPRGRWVLSERIVVSDLGHSMTQLPNGDILATAADGKTLRRSSDGARTWEVMEGAKLPGRGPFVVLKSGRWLSAVSKVNQEWTGGRTQIVGTRDGYPLIKHSGNAYDSSLVVSYSDDQGKTWTAGEAFKGPFLWAVASVDRFIEGPDDTVSLPIFGCVTPEEMSSYSSSNGVIRSHDQGKTWIDFSFIFRTQPKGPDDLQAEPRYNEMDVVDLENGHWVAFSRSEYETHGPRGSLTTRCAISSDFGQTWRATGSALQMVSQQRGIALPDGGIAFCYRSHSWQAPGVAISYDEGRSFDYMLAGPYETVHAAITAEDEFMFFSIPSHRSDSKAGVYRWVAGTAAP